MQQQVAQRIGQTVAFAAFHLFGAIKAALFAGTGRFGTLTINDSSTRFWVSIERNPDVFAQAVIHLLQGDVSDLRPNGQCSSALLVCLAGEARRERSSGCPVHTVPSPPRPH